MSTKGVDPEILKHYYENPPGTKFDEDRNNPNFWLGPVVGSHVIGEYQFVEYEETCFRSGADYGKLTGQHSFSIYINGHCTSRAEHSLDMALLTAITYKRDGHNSQAARLFWKATEPEITNGN